MGGGVLGGGGTLREKTPNSKKASRLVGASWMSQLWQNFGIRVGLHGPADVLTVYTVGPQGASGLAWTAGRAFQPGSRGRPGGLPGLPAEIVPKLRRTSGKDVLRSCRIDYGRFRTSCEVLRKFFRDALEALQDVPAGRLPLPVRLPLCQNADLWMTGLTTDPARVDRLWKLEQPPSFPGRLNPSQ